MDQIGADRHGAATLGQEPDERITAPWRALFSFTTKRHGTIALPAIIISVISGCIVPAESFLYGKVFAEFANFGAEATSSRDFVSAVDKYALWLVVLGAASWLLYGADFSAWTLYGAVQAAHARDKLFMAMLDRDIGWFDMRKHGVGALLARLNMYLLEFQAATSIPLGLVVQQMTCAIVSLGVAFYLAWDLTLITVSILPFASIGVWYCSKHVQPNIDAQAEKLGEAAKHSTNAMASIESVKFFNGQDKELYTYTSVMSQASRFYSRQIYWNSAQAAILRFATLGMFVQGFWYGSHLVLSGRRDAGAVVTTFWSTMMATQAIMCVMPMLLTLEKGRMAGARLRSVVTSIEDKPIRLLEDKRPAFQTCFGQINITGLCFRYPARPEQLILKDVSLDFPAGTLAFVIGKSGSGKSTIGQLLSRCYNFEEGQILLDGRSISNTNLEWLRDNVLLVEQNSVLFDETVARNIAFGRKDFDRVSREEIKAAARFALLDNMIKELPNGLDTTVGAKGGTLSGGQRQRMALARARIRDPAVVILDESTSALDYVNRATIMNNIRRWRRGKTTIIITHDIAQILPDDPVYLLQNGEVAQQGTRRQMEAEPGSPFQAFLQESESSLPQVEVVDTQVEANKPLPRLATFRPHTTATFNEVGEDGASACTPPAIPTLRSSLASDDPVELCLAQVAYRQSIFLPSLFSNNAGSSAYQETVRPASIVSPFWKVVPSSAPVGPFDLDQQQSRGWRNSGLSVNGFDMRSSDMDCSAADVMGRAIFRPRDNRPLSTITGVDKSFRRRSDDLSWYDRQLSIADSEAFEMKDVSLQSPDPRGERYSVETAPQQEMDDTQLLTLKSIFATLWPQLSWQVRLLLVSAFFWLIVFAFSTPVFSWVFAKLLGTFYNPENAGQMAMIYSLSILGIATLDAVATFCYQSQLYVVGQNWVNSLRFEGLRRILRQPRQFFDIPGNEVGRMAEVLDAMAEMMQGLLGRFVPAVVLTSLMMSIAVIWGMTASWKLTLVGVAVMPAVYAVTRAYDIVNGKLDYVAQGAVENVSAVFSETFTSIKTVKSLILEAHFTKKFKKANSRCLHAATKRALVSGLFYGLAECSIIYVTALLFHYGAVLAASHAVSVNDIIVVFTELLFGLSNVQAILCFVPQMSTCRDAASRLLRLSRLPESNFEHQGTTHITAVGEISFTNCSFSYPSSPDHPVLKNLNLTIAPGRCTALVGSSGSGKSTIAALLLKLYTTSDFSTKAAPMISLSGRDIRSIHTPTLRSLITIVSQTPFLFPASIAANITYGLRKGSPQNNMQAIRAAAGAADIHDFIMSLPNGYDTIIGEGGTGLSGGQAQRISIAHALVRKPDVLILDEATSALDVESAAAIRATVQQLLNADSQRGLPKHDTASLSSPSQLRKGNSKQLTVIVITHAKEMMKIADNVVMLDCGRLVEQGGYEELLQTGGPFSRLINGDAWGQESRAVQRRSLLLMENAAGVNAVASS